MWTCPKCKEPMHDHDEHCWSCGMRNPALPEEPPAAPGEEKLQGGAKPRVEFASLYKKKCPYCAEEILFEAIKCRYCGTLMPDSQKKALSPEGARVSADTKARGAGSIPKNIVMTGLVAVASVAVIAAAVIFAKPIAGAISSLVPQTAAGAGRTNGSPRAIETAVGEEFAIMLGSNTADGYEWQLARPLDGAMLKLSSSKYIPAAGKRSGAAGHEEWTFKALGAGETTIAFKHIKSQEKDARPEKEKAFSVIIK